MKYKSETYVVIKGNEILRVYKTAQGMAGIISSLAHENITEYDEIRKYPNFFEGKVGQDIRSYSSKGKLRNESDLIKEGLKEPGVMSAEERNKLIQTEIYKMAEERLIASGVIK
jgi:hypothetical protein